MHNFLIKKYWFIRVLAVVLWLKPTNTNSNSRHRLESEEEVEKNNPRRPLCYAENNIFFVYLIVCSQKHLLTNNEINQNLDRNMK